ncbi:hypothetical protein DB88DRAFT_181817 [Papiliotrema laurentii]|uniref:Uncharacterized protein n=1 Tax=Papiliotrema laurentii TaxID=5418 RepID=A0AAD9L8Y7_PAPLA|nr:hypothetical protein DB88DRAFT_181817 [Papiliotrema laurentii]
MMALDSAQRAVPSWDDQIVPTLRKRTCPTSPFLTCETILPSPFRSARPLGASERSCPHSRSVDHSSRIGLESESAYLSSRLSSSQFHDHTGHSPSPSYGSPGLSSGDEGFGAGTTSQRSHNTPRREVATQSRIPVATSSRTRTKSSPFASPAGSPDPSCTPRAESRGRRDRDPGPSRLDGDLVSDTNGDGEEDHSPSKIPRRPRPTRPRSKSQLAPRTKFVDTDSHPPLPAPSSSIPRPSASRRGSSPSKPDFTRSPRSPASGFEYDDLDRSPSPELPHAKVVEGLVKNELPPFAIFPDDAMRIAERGHDLDDESDGEYGEDGRMAAGALSRSVGGLSSEDTRRRSLSKRPDARSEHEPEAIVASANRSKQTETGLGLPSGAARRTSGQNRSTSSKPAQLSLNSPLDGHGGVTVSTPRSASLNMLSSSAGMSSSTSSSRLGVAAHLVPPENAYTPPKGANWDEVLLPTVAKKLGMNEPASVERAGDEGDLAVEWDRDGTPVKWVKRGVLGNSQRVNTRPNFADSPPSGPPAFSPTFEPSPDNPLRYQTSFNTLAPSPSRHNSQGNGMRHKDPTEEFELGQLPSPIRTTQGAQTSIHREPSGMDRSNLESTSTGTTESASVSRRPSFMRRITQQSSRASLRTAAANQLWATSNGQPVFAGEAQQGSLRYRPGQGQGWDQESRHFDGSNNYFDTARPGTRPVAGSRGSSNIIIEAAAGRPNTGRGGLGDVSGRDQAPGKKGKKAGHGKGEDVEGGCGCVVM